MIELGHQFGLYVIKEIISARDNYVCCKAEDPFFNREVALKVYPVEHLTLGERLPPLEKLLESLAGLDHRSIAPIYDSGLEGDNYYYTTAYYYGGCLTDQLSESMSTPQVLRLAVELTQALEYALEHGLVPGRLSAEKIFFDADGHAVISAFGLVGGIEQILHSSEQINKDQDKKDLTNRVAETLHAVGELLLMAIIGSSVVSDERIDDLLAKIDDPQLKELLGRLLLPGECRFATYAELMEELAGFSELAPLLKGKTDKSKGLTAYSAPENQEKPPVDEQAIVKIRQLVAENNTLLQSLDKAVYTRNVAENKISEKDRELAAVKALTAKLQEEANVAWELVAGQKNERWRPVAWTVGGFVLGFLLSGSFGYYYSEQTRNELLAKLKANEELIKTAAWRSTAPGGPAEQQPSQVVVGSVVESGAQQLAELKPTLDAEQSPVDVQAMVLDVAPVKEVSQQWWPAGNEFSPTAAIPIEQIKAALGFQSVVTGDGLPDSLRQEVLAVVNHWAESWSKQDLGQYFALYSENYQPELGRSQEQWRDLRRQRLTTPQYIELQLDGIRFRQIDENRIQVKLQQSYRSDFYQDRILKSINLIKENGSWRILMERSLGMIDDIVGG